MSETKMESNSTQFPNRQVAVLGMLLPAVGWYMADYGARALRWLFYAKQEGVFNGLVRIDYHNFLGDPFAWGGLIGRWFSLTLPAIILITMALVLQPLIWKVTFRLVA